MAVARRLPGTSTDLFFHPEGERGAARAAREAAAKAICGRCPVLGPCRDHALAAREPYGVWGGLSEAEREDLLSRIDGSRPARTLHGRERACAYS